VQLFEGEDEEKPADPPQVPKAADESGSRWVTYRKLNCLPPSGMKKRTNTFKQFNVNL